MQPGVLAIGSAALALWLAVRFDGLWPRSPGDALVRAGAACVLGAFVEPLMGFWLGLPLPRPGFFAVMLGAVPVLVAMFLTGAWLLLALRGSFAEGPRPVRRDGRPRAFRLPRPSLAGLAAGRGGDTHVPMTRAIGTEIGRDGQRLRGAGNRVVRLGFGRPSVSLAALTVALCLGLVLAVVLY